ncbi:hypothetical protein GP486_005077 [Trichoglossum hirsutum]|uniref:Nephrocystin 3-like N-terminal domain-containing protein n=1 Tax=Trichoglossum hirsutum TaxID=265104 RepID=A0A9P8LA31_9PEZI|nr:hypothetical protein GP486_005077 [Trichoglossum hirsutum]
MDPLSITASVAAILQLTGQIISTCASYVSAIKNAPQRLTAIKTEVQSLEAIIRVIDLTQQKLRPQSPFVTPLNVPLDACRLCLKELSELLECGNPTTGAPPGSEPGQRATKRSKTLPTLASLAWPFKDNKAKAIMEDVAHHKATLATCVGAVNYSRWVSCEQSILEISPNLKSLRSTIQEESSLSMRAALYAWLSPPNAEESYCTAAAKRSPGTCNWIFNHATYQMWKGGDGGQILWLDGIAGSGKSVLCAAAIQALHANAITHQAMEFHQRHEQPKDVTVAYFFFDRADITKRKPSHLLAAVISQLISGSKVAFKRVSEWARSATAGSASQLWRTPANLPVLEQVFLGILGCSGPSLDTPVVLVVDAVDEGEETGSVISVLLRLALSKRVKILFTSRPDVTISRALELHPHSTFRISVDPPSVTQDIMTYVTLEVENLIQSRAMVLRDPSLKEELITDLTKRSDGMFLLAYCYTANLSSCFSDRDIRQSLSQLPMKLNDAYREMLEHLQNSMSGNRRFGLLLPRLFLWVGYTCRPLTLGELCVAISVENDDTDLDPSNLITDPQSILKIGGNFLTVHRETGRVGFAHSSVREFLLAQPERRLLPSDAEAHVLIASVCLHYLQLPVVYKRMKQLAKGGTQQELAVGQLYDDKFALLPYAARFWSTHTQQITADAANGDEVQALLYKFLFGKTGSFSVWQKAYEFEVLAPKLSKASSDDAGGSRPSGPIALVLLKENMKFQACLNGRQNQSAPVRHVLDDFEVQVEVANRTSASAMPYREYHDNEQQRLELRSRVERYVSNWNRAPVSPLHHLARTVFSATLEKALHQLGWSPDVRGGVLDSTPLHEASKHGSAAAARVLLDAEATANCKDRLGKTPLFYASHAGSLPVVKLLLDHGAKPDECDWYNTSPLHEASRHGHIPVVEALLDRWPNGVSERDNDGNTPLSVSLRSRTLDSSCAIFLLQRGATLLPSDLPHVLNHHQSVPFLQALVQRSNQTLDRADSLVDILCESSATRYQEFLTRLLALGLSIRSDKADGSNTLCKAVRELTSTSWDRQEITPIPLNHGPYWWLTAPHEISKGITALLEHGALCRQETGTTCLHQLASRRGREAADLVRPILDAGCAIEAEDEEGYTPFLRAVQAQNFNLATALLSLGGANARLNDTDSQTGGFLDVVNWRAADGGIEPLLLHLITDKGLSLNARNRRGRTALHELAACRVSDKTAHMMDWTMKHGGDPCVTDSGGNTPLHIVLGSWGEPYAQGNLSSKPYADALLDMARAVPRDGVRTSLRALVGQSRSQWSMRDSCHYGYIVQGLREIGGLDG